MRLRTLITILLLPTFFLVKAQSSEKEFQFKFNLAKHELSHRKMKQALPTLLDLHEMDSTNANINYLIGVCFVEGNIVTEKSIYHLLKAKKDIEVDYNSDSYSEKNAPIYVYYYLSIAYSQNKLCDSATSARNSFMEIYTFEDQYYPAESQRWLNECIHTDEVVVANLDFLKKKEEKTEEKNLTIAPVSMAQTEETSIPPRKSEVKTNIPKNPSKVITKEVEYTTTMPLYGVQVGAFKEIMPVRRFPDLKNVDAFVDKDGWVRYVIGHFSYRSQAESLKDVIISAGYPDVFIVDVNNEKKYTESVVSIDDLSLRSVISGPIEFKVQLGVFKSEIPRDIAESYLKISHIEESQHGAFTYITSTSFPSYSQAIRAKDQYVKIGVADAFIVAYNKKKKIPLIEALNYTHENPITILQ